MDRGWIKLHRKIADNIFLMHDDNAFNVFVKLLIYVNSNGEYAAGRNVLGELLHINPRTLYDVLIRLESQQLIKITSNKRYSVITICKWETYQRSPNNKLLNVPTIAQPQPNNEPTTGQHYNKNKKENKNKNQTGFNKSKTLNKKAYAVAVEADELLSKKEQFRKPVDEGSGYKKALSIAEALRQRKLGLGK